MALNCPNIANVRLPIQYRIRLFINPRLSITVPKPYHTCRASRPGRNQERQGQSSSLWVAPEIAGEDATSHHVSTTRLENGMSTFGSCHIVPGLVPCVPGKHGRIGDRCRSSRMNHPRRSYRSPFELLAALRPSVRPAHSGLHDAALTTADYLL
jgi:hypothetical protein